ncbi:MAG: hypothetical protein H0U95_16700 [Bacteroidetes bacterium]|nr:hypothetical protein [Bacteroidota bacterium]
MTVYHIAAHLSALFVILPVIIGRRNKNFIPPSIKPLYYLLYISFAFDAFGITLNELNINNMFLGYFFTAIEFIFLITVYRRFFNIGNSLFYPIAGSFFLMVMGEAFYSSLYQYNSLSAGTESTILILCSLLAFYRVMQTMMFERDLLSEPFFYINTAILIYFAGDLFLFLMSSYLQTHRAKQFPELYLFHSVFHVVYYVLIALGFVQLKKKLLVSRPKYAIT